VVIIYKKTCFSAGYKRNLAKFPFFLRTCHTPRRVLAELGMIVFSTNMSHAQACFCGIWIDWFLRTCHTPRRVDLPIDSTRPIKNQ